MCRQFCSNELFVELFMFNTALWKSSFLSEFIGTLGHKRLSSNYIILIDTFIPNLRAFANIFGALTYQAILGGLIQQTSFNI